MTLRRDFLAFTAGAVAARTVLPLAARAEGVHPDAALIAACTAFPARLAAANASIGEDTPEDAALDQVDEVILCTRPQTLAGVLAKAKAAYSYGVDNYTGIDPCPHGKYASLAAWRSWHVVNDLLRLEETGVIGGAA